MGSLFQTWRLLLLPKSLWAAQAPALDALSRLAGQGRHNWAGALVDRQSTHAPDGTLQTLRLHRRPPTVPTPQQTQDRLPLPVGQNADSLADQPYAYLSIR